MKARIKRTVINPAMLFHLMKTGTAWSVTKGIPEGAKMRGITMDPFTQLLHLFVEHDSFDLVDLDKEVSSQIEMLFRKK